MNIRCIARGMLSLSLAVLMLAGCTEPAQSAPPPPSMPSHWKVTADYPVSAGQLRALSKRLDAQLSGVRNTVYDVYGKRVQINVIITPDEDNADRLMASLRSIKVEKAMLRKGLVVYEFVGSNDVLPLIDEARRHLDRF